MPVNNFSNIFFFPPNESRSHEADLQEQNLSRNQIRFKGSDFQIKKTYKRYLIVFVKFDEHSFSGSNIQIPG